LQTSSSSFCELGRISQNCGVANDGSEYLDRDDW
jgi:hypothetical protein